MIKRVIPFIAAIFCTVLLCGCTFNGAVKPADSTSGAEQSDAAETTGEQSNTAVEKGAYIANANSFSEGAAWIVTACEDGKYKTSLITPELKTLYETEKTDKPDRYIATNFKNGVSLLKDTKTDAVSLISSKGEVIWSTNGEGIKDGERIYGEGGVESVEAFYYVNESEPKFEKIKAGAYFNGYTVICYNRENYGVLKPDGTWLMEPVFLDVYTFEFNSDSAYTAFRYDKQSDFFALNFRTGELSDLGKGESIIYPTDSEITKGWQRSHDFDVHGGLLYDKDKNGFVNEREDVVIDLSKYELIGHGQGVYDYAPEFYGGYCVLTVLNGGKVQTVIIDKDGNELFSPTDHPCTDESGIRSHIYGYYDGYGFMLCGKGNAEYYQFTKTDDAVYYLTDGKTIGFLKEYKSVYPFSDGSSLVFDGSEYDYVNAEGKRLFK